MNNYAQLVFHPHGKWRLNNVPPVKFWQCPNCGQVHFGDDPPDMCAFCQDFTTWKPLPGDSRASEDLTKKKTVNKAPHRDE